MKNEYQKPEMEYIIIISQENITTTGDVVDGSMGVEDSTGIPGWG